VYNKKDKEGYYKLFISDSVGNNEVQITFPGWRKDRHQWAEEWHPSGKYIFCYVEKSEYVKEKGHKRKPVDAIPGYGAYTDLWLITRDGKQAWQLINLPNNYKSGIIHSAISPDGKMFGWSERIAAPKFSNMNLAAGAYVLKIADFIFDSIPRFDSIRTFKPGEVLAANELESISIYKTTIAFYSTFESKNLFRTHIYTLNIITGEIKKLTTQSFAQAPTYSLSGNKIIYMTGFECDIFPLQLQGADWWIMNTDGSDKIRLTYMNKWNHKHSVNKYRLAGCISFISENVFLGSIMTKSLGLTGYTVKVEINY
jgi:Tol biopolymer transport system component